MAESSYECRWFFSGRPAESVVERFRCATGGWSGSAGGLDWPDRWRSDEYVPVARDMGVKIRREPDEPRKLEFKGLLSRDGAIVFGKRVQGYAERWVKWSYEGDEIESGLVDLLDVEARTVVVRKKRIMRLIRLDPHGRDEEVPVDAMIDRALQIELTRIVLPEREDEAHWTLSFEAFSADANLAEDVNLAEDANPAEDVRRNVSPFLTEMAAVSELRLENSMSYPEWLGR